jgi:hypothetical protein
MTVVELVFAGAVLAVAACGLSMVLVTSMGTATVNRETTQARAAAKQMIEQIQNIPAGDVFATFNGVSEDDPLGVGTAPGGLFMIETKPATVQVSNMTGEILFPGSGKTGVLREDIEDPELGLPADLNGDGVIDSENHANDYLLLPVRIRVRWRGIAGERTFEMCSVLLNK